MSKLLKNLFDPKGKDYLGKPLKPVFKTNLVIEPSAIYLNPEKDPVKRLSKYEIIIIQNFIDMWAKHLDKTGERLKNYIKINERLAIDFGLSDCPTKNNDFDIYVNIKNS